MIRSVPFARLMLLAAAATIALRPGGAAAQQAEPAEPDVTIRKDLPYLEAGRTERLDLYLPAARAEGVRSPGVVIIHGGGWRGGDKGASREINIGTTLAKAGYVCASINYRLFQPGRGAVWPGNLQDCKNAVRYLRVNAAEYGIDPAHIGVIGGSAGGHLSLMVAFTPDHPTLSPPQPYPGTSDKVDAVVDLYGISNPHTWQETDRNGEPTGVFKPGCADMLGGLPDAVPDRWREAAPVTHITEKTAPVLILHGTADTTVDRDQSRELADRLKERGVEHQLMLIEGIGHTFDLQKWNRKPLPADLRPVVTGFFDKYLKR